MKTSLPGCDAENVPVCPKEQGPQRVCTSPGDKLDLGTSLKKDLSGCIKSCSLEMKVIKITLPLCMALHFKPGKYYNHYNWLVFHSELSIRHYTCVRYSC